MQKKLYPKKTLSDQDVKYATAFLSVLEASSDFWNDDRIAKISYNHSPSMAIGSDDDCETEEEQKVEVLAADAAGAAWGFLAGPLTSIGNSAAFSLIAMANDDTCE